MASIDPDRRKRPWTKLRVVVEVTVPPTSRATEKHLMYALKAWMPDTVSLPNYTASHHEAAVRVKTFKPFYRAYKLLERKARK